jgi:predicted lipid-binding transport protein (Tim44 family)
MSALNVDRFFLKFSEFLVNKFFGLILTMVLAFSVLNAEAARRLGGGKSSGQQSNNVTQREAVKPAAPAAPSQAAAPAKSAAPAASPAAPAKRPWGAMLGGLAAGLGLAWLAHSLGMGEAFGNMLMFALLAMVAVGVIGYFLRSRKGGAAQQQGDLAYQGAGQTAQSPATLRQYNPEKVGNDASARPWEAQDTRFDPAPDANTHSPANAGGSMIGSAIGASQPTALQGSQSWGVPEGFDSVSFIDAAKRNFITLQEAWDRADMDSLKAMMTDGMLSEIKSQLAEREANFPGQPNKTEVVKLDAQLLGIEELPEVYMASVEFNGVIREEADAAPSPFREVWNMTKPRNGNSGWLVAGVQALQ